MENLNDNNDNKDNINNSKEQPSKEQIYDSIIQPMQMNVRQVFVKKETKERIEIREQFPIFAMLSVLYSVLFTACMYKNLHGIASTIMVICTEVFAYATLRKLGYEFKKKHILHAVIISLLGINLFFTMDYFLLFVDYIAILLVFITGIFSVIYDTSSWDLVDSLMAIFAHVFGSLENIFAIGSDWSVFAKNKNRKVGIVSYIFIGLIITVPILTIVLILLSFADAVFGNMITSIIGDFEFGDIFGIGFVFVGALLGSYAWMTYFVNDSIKVSSVNKRTKEPAILIVVGITLGLVYLLFCGIQIVYLFAGVGDLPTGYTYAKYAREGFSELMFVCLINLIIVLVGVKHFKENIVLKIILTVITACTYLMIVSSAYRMFMYVSVYQMSLLRIWVLWTLVWLTFILTGALISIYNNNFSLFLYSMIVTSVLYLSFAYARPAYLVASYNLSDRYEQEKIDYRYIRNNLNPDATAPVLKFYENADSEIRDNIDEFFPTYDEKRDNKTTIRNFNISKYKYYKQNIR